MYMGTGAAVLPSTQLNHKNRRKTTCNKKPEFGEKEEKEKW